MASAKAICNKQSKQCHKLCVFLYEIYFHLGHFYFEFNLNILWWYQINQEWTFYYKKVPLKITNNYCYKVLKYSKFMQKEIKQNTIRKKIILKGNITTTYIEHKYESTRTSVLSPPQNVET